MGKALVIGAGPAGLMAAEVLAKAGVAVTLVDHKPSVARKFLMAGKSGLNLTKHEKDAQFLAAYRDSAAWLAPMIDRFGAAEVMEWAEDLGQDLFVGSTDRVFPKAMKASPLLRAWLARLDDMKVDRRVKWHWTGWDADTACFDTPDGPQNITADVTVLALGGASWARLGSDGAWFDTLAQAGVSLTPFAPSNMGISVKWSEKMARNFGLPLKNILLRAGDMTSRGEVTISDKGIEGGGIYALSPALRDQCNLTIDLLPDLPLDGVITKLRKPRGKMSSGTYLRKTLKLDPAKIGLLNECARPLPGDPVALACVIKTMPIAPYELRPMDEAISTVGGVPQSAVTHGLMLRAKKGVFVCGEMLDWDAPTGGYLLTACLSTGAWAGHAAVDYIARS